MFRNMFVCCRVAQVSLKTYSANVLYYRSGLWPVSFGHYSTHGY